MFSSLQDPKILRAGHSLHVNPELPRTLRASARISVMPDSDEISLLMKTQTSRAHNNCPEPEAYLTRVGWGPGGHKVLGNTVNGPCE